MNKTQQEILNKLANGDSITQNWVNTVYPYKPSVTNIINRLRSRGAEIQESNGHFFAVNPDKIKVEVQ